MAKLMLCTRNIKLAVCYYMQNSHTEAISNWSYSNIYIKTVLYTSNTKLVLLYYMHTYFESLNIGGDVLTERHRAGHLG